MNTGWGREETKTPHLSRRLLMQGPSKGQSANTENLPVRHTRRTAEEDINGDHLDMHMADAASAKPEHGSRRGCGLLDSEVPQWTRLTGRKWRG